MPEMNRAALVLTLLVHAAAAPAAEPLATLVVDAGEHERIDTPVPFPPPPGMEAGKACALVELGGAGRTLPCQLAGGDGARAWFILAGKTPAGATRRFRLVAREAGGKRRVEARKGDGAVDLAAVGADGEEVGRILRYHHAALAPPEKVSKRYARSAFIHPAWSPSGDELTHNFPRDHYHHKGIWMPWTKAVFRGKGVDFWNLGGGKGTVRFVEYVWVGGGRVFGGFAARHEHVVAPGKPDEVVALNETWRVRAYNVGGPGAGFWLWDIASTQRCATDDPLILPKYRYGGMGYRGAPGWKGKTAYTLTSEGKHRNNAHGTRAKWCALGGETDGDWAGGAFLAHPENFRFPEPMRIWPGRKNVFVCWTPSQAGEWRIEPGRDYRWRYRFVAYDGKADADLLERLWADFAHPPSVTVQKE